MENINRYNGEIKQPLSNPEGLKMSKLKEEMMEVHEDTDFKVNFRCDSIR